MSEINNINRRKFLEIFTGCTCGIVISSCTTAPITERKQLKLLPESTINRQAADLYERVKAKTKLSNNIKQLNEVLKIHKLNEIVFSAKDVNANEIMKHMSNINNHLSIKISPSESTFIIGSNSIHTQGDLYVLNNDISKKNSIKVFFKKYIDFFS